MSTSSNQGKFSKYDRVQPTLCLSCTSILISALRNVAPWLLYLGIFLSYVLGIMPRRLQLIPYFSRNGNSVGYRAQLSGFCVLSGLCSCARCRWCSRCSVGGWFLAVVWHLWNQEQLDEDLKGQFTALTIKFRQQIILFDISCLRFVLMMNGISRCRLEFFRSDCLVDAHLRSGQGNVCSLICPSRFCRGHREYRHLMSDELTRPRSACLQRRICNEYRISLSAVQTNLKSVSIPYPVGLAIAFGQLRPRAHKHVN